MENDDVLKEALTVVVNALVQERMDVAALGAGIGTLRSFLPDQRTVNRFDSEFRTATEKSQRNLRNTDDTTRKLLSALELLRTL